MNKYSFAGRRFLIKISTRSASCFFIRCELPTDIKFIHCNSFIHIYHNCVSSFSNPPYSMHHPQLVWFVIDPLTTSLQTLILQRKMIILITQRTSMFTPYLSPQQEKLLHVHVMSVFPTLVPWALVPLAFPWAWFMRGCMSIANNQLMYSSYQNVHVCYDLTVIDTTNLVLIF